MTGGEREERERKRETYTRARGKKRRTSNPDFMSSNGENSTLGVTARPPVFTGSPFFRRRI